MSEDNFIAKIVASLIYTQGFNAIRAEEECKNAGGEHTSITLENTKIYKFRDNTLMAITGTGCSAFVYRQPRVEGGDPTCTHLCTVSKNSIIT
jgi:hypothetical protein